MYDNPLNDKKSDSNEAGFGYIKFLSNDVINWIINAYCVKCHAIDVAFTKCECWWYLFALM